MWSRASSPAGSDRSARPRRKGLVNHAPLTSVNHFPPVARACACARAHCRPLEVERRTCSALVSSAWLPRVRPACCWPPAWRPPAEVRERRARKPARPASAIPTCSRPARRPTNGSASVPPSRPRTRRWGRPRPLRRRHRAPAIPDLTPATGPTGQRPSRGSPAAGPMARRRCSSRGQVSSRNSSSSRPMSSRRLRRHRPPMLPLPPLPRLPPRPRKIRRSRKSARFPNARPSSGPIPSRRTPMLRSGSGLAPSICFPRSN